MSIIKKYFLFLACVFLGSEVFGQAARSPFTALSIGEPYSPALINTQGMAGVGVSQPQYWFLNNQNPALLVFNNYTVFQAGILYESRTVKSASASQKNVGGNMNYLATAFPIKPGRWTTSLGLMPYTTVNYKTQYLDAIQNSTGQIKVVEEGKGGLTQLYWSNGVRLNKDFAVGMKAAYIFSSILNTYTNQLDSSYQPLNYPVVVQERLYVKDFAFSGGLSYSKDSLFTKKKYRFSAGLVYSFAADLKTHQRNVLYRNTGALNLDADTLLSSKGRLHIPPSLTGGISLSNSGKWSLGTEFSYQDWGAFKNVDGKSEGLSKSWRTAFGGEFTPDAGSGAYLKRLTYRAGASMERYPFLSNDKQVKDVGINFGLSLPAGRSSLDVAFKFGKRGNKADNILEETYFKIYFGITFNDQWFIKRKFD